jgi:acyl-coenzyme A synthetase/AMP-(fatty) acid ligase
VWEFFWPLMVGARLAVAAPGAHRDPAQLAGAIVKYQVSTLHFVPSMLQAFVASEHASRCADVLRRIVCSGEALPAELQNRVFEVLPGVELHNLYGPTEAAIDVTAWQCRAEAGLAVPIGAPIAATQTWVLDSRMEPVPRGVAGELYLGGAGLARGYLGRPGLTAERFVPDPFDTKGSGSRLYRTGDLVRWRGDGVLDYLGRLDHQVKIRGFRIELGELEARLAELDGVREAVVVAHEGRLVAYVTPEAASGTDAEADTEALDVADLKAQLAKAVPDYMVPWRPGVDAVGAHRPRQQEGFEAEGLEDAVAVGREWQGGAARAAAAAGRRRGRQRAGSAAGRDGDATGGDLVATAERRAYRPA